MKRKRNKSVQIDAKLRATLTPSQMEKLASQKRFIT